jgi:outer membrane protein
MKRQLFLIITVLSLTVLGLAQDPTPTPTPTAAPKVDDTQSVKPENLQGVPPIAPSYQSDDKKLPDLGRVGVDMLEQKTLGLRDAIKLALENNKDIEVSRQNVRIAEFEFQAASGVYEPRLTGQTFFERATTPNVSIFSSNEKITNNSVVGNLTYQGFIKKYGSSYSVTASNQRVTTDNTLSLLSPQYNANLTFNFTQPLFRGRKIDQQRRTIEISKKNLSLTDTQFRQRSIETIATTQRAYWDLTFALRNLQVQRDGVRDAKEQLEHNKRLVNEGQLAPIDIVAAETQIANLELAVYDALDVVNRAENALKNLIAKDKNDSIWSVSLIPTDNVDLEAPNTTLPEALDLALQNRPEIELNETAKEINEIDRRFLKDQTKPQIDLVATYTSTGIAGTQNPNLRPPFGGNQEIVVPDYLTGGVSQLPSDIFANRYPTFRVGVNINLPFKNETAKANLGKNLVEGERIQTQREQLEQVIQVDVRNALQSLRTAEARLRAAAISRENTIKQYESEQRKLDAGQSDIYKVLERQTALMNARSAELRAQTELNKAIADLQRATGNSLKANNVEARLRK